jgi:hypothetical protein
MFPKIPENLTEVSASDLRQLVRQLKLVGREQIALNKTEADAEAKAARYAEIKTAMEAIPTLQAAIAEKEAEAEAEDAFQEDEEPEVVEATDVPDADDDDDADDETDEDAEDETHVSVEVAASATPAKVRRQVGASPKTAAVVPAGQRLAPSALLARDGVSGKRTGESFDSWTEVATALNERAASINPASDSKHEVAFVQGRYDEAHTLTDDPVFNLQLFDEEMQAAMCAPLPPNYDLSCMNTTRRPVRASLPSFAAGNPRMGVRIYPSPSLSDITTGVGVWTVADDNNPSATKEACATITCATPVDYRMYGVYRCLTVTNMGHMSFPELTEAYLNRLAAAHAREAELQLLEAMAAGTTTVQVPHVGYGGSVTVIRALLQYLTNYREQQRWDDGEMDVWLHRSILTSLKADLVSRRSTSGAVLRVPTDGDINAIFSNAGFSPNWFLDRPSWVTPLPAFQVGGTLGEFPRNIEMLVAPRGKFGLMDRGQLSIGVTGNGIYRDNTSNSKNNFTYFFENFEGVVDTNSCPAHILNLDNVCWNGQQIDDVYIDCEGDRAAGEAGS